MALPVTEGSARRGRKQVLLRLDPAVHDALSKWAADELRSTNAQIDYLLRQALKEAGRLPRGARPHPGRGRPAKSRPAGDAAETAEPGTAEDMRETGGAEGAEEPRQAGRPEGPGGTRPG
ncbi:hypothetical protein RM779_10350 [Streptomyces sp. DSM 41886]|uniref:Toxin-antitoxin system HicB family antitoxin n=1 Tax=Streptomyces johnsoniae TaxID=3075532 RepID=A0ABU2S5U0_9ACTN|nr:hypothetical protein [Streptomyces sp. DSM 41886]MDT0442995.1 hypothetical protein [Streptomyces sp. DSM 41886]